MDREFFKDKKVVVMGLGQFGGGLDSAIFAAKAGARVVVTDIADPQSLADTIGKLKQYYNIEYHLGGHIEEDFNDQGDTDIIIVNPAVPPNNTFLQMAADAGKLITSQIEIFFQMCPAKIVGITGANGKSTTTAITHHLLLKGAEQEGVEYHRVWLGGNIGYQPLLAILDEIADDDIAVLEISSFQAEHLARIEAGPYISVITNLTPNHLDRHGTFAEYCNAKENLFRFQKPNEADPVLSVFSAEDPVTIEMSLNYRDQAGRKCVTFGANDVPEGLADKFPLAGRMNLLNLAAAITVARHLGITYKTIEESIVDFQSLPHRLERVAEINGVRWYDDSIATTPVSAIAALDSFDAPKIIIAGGYDKNIPFAELGEKIALAAKAAILIGQTADKIAQAIAVCRKSEAQVEIVSSLADAVKMASKIAERGDVVLLSPACASYDMFENFHQRGEIFKELVNAL